MSSFVIEDTGIMQFLEGENNAYKDPDCEYALLDDNSGCEDGQNFVLEEENIDWLDPELDVNSAIDNSIPELESENVNVEISGNSAPLGQCVVLDVIDSKIQRCKNQRFRPLKQLLGIWELDFSTVNSIFKQGQLESLETLSVCTSHFNFDQDGIHKRGRGLKGQVSIEKSWIHKSRCLFCHNDRYFFSRGGRCIIHSWIVMGRNIRLPCIGVEKCPVFNENNMTQKATNNTRCRFVCSECFIREGGHFLQQKGRGRGVKKNNCNHDNDTSDSLELIGKWLLNVAKTETNNEFKTILLQEIAKSLATVFKKTDVSTQTNDTDRTRERVNIVNPAPSHMVMKMALRLQKVNINKLDDLAQLSQTIEKKPNQFGKALGCLIWKSRQDMKKNKHCLENPSSLRQYRNSFPSVVRDVFDSMFDYIQKQKWTVVRQKQQQRGLGTHEYDTTRSEKISTFMISVLLTVGFPSVNIWLTHMLSSLCHKPNLQSSVYAVLCTANVVSHTSRHEKRLEKARKKKADPKQRLLRGNNIYNLCVIDNIDFMEKTFKYDNIFDTSRRTAHATLRMVFQFEFDRPLSEVIAEEKNTETTFRIGESEFTEAEITKYSHIFSMFLDNRGRNFTVGDIITSIKSQTECQCNLPAPKVVILKPGDNPNTNDNVHKAALMYADDVGIENNNHIDIVADESIFRRLVSLRDTHPEMRFILGGWHTNKCMCAALIRIFSGYGIFNLARVLGVRHIEKWEKMVDYNAASRVMTLIWGSVGIAIHRYIKEKNQTLDDIMSGSNNVLKVWYLFFRWCSYWVGHKIGIRQGNWTMQMENLRAFAPLFPVAGCNHYAQSVPFFISYIDDNPSLRAILSKVCSINLTRPGHYFAFDEGLERFGVQYVKQNIGNTLGNSDELDLQISSVQSERERLNLLLREYVGKKSFVSDDRILQSRQSASWNLVDDLVDAFLSPDPTQHRLFQDTSENCEEGFQRLFTSFEIGEDRENKIFREDVKKTQKRNVTGRRKSNVVRCPAIKYKRKPKSSHYDQPSKRRRISDNSNRGYPDMQDYMTVWSLE